MRTILLTVSLAVLSAAPGAAWQMVDTSPVNEGTVRSPHPLGTMEIAMEKALLGEPKRA